MCLLKENTVKRSLHVQRTSQASQLARKLHLTIARDLRSRAGRDMRLTRACPSTIAIFKTQVNKVQP